MNEPPPAIETRGLTKYFGASRAIEDLDLIVARGEVFGFLGPNGAGKTTTIRALLGLLHPTRGRATVLGYDAQTDAREVHKRVGYLPGELQLFGPLTGADHIAWFHKVRGVTDPSLGQALVERFGVVTDRPVRSLSKGNRQKLGLVLALAHRPELAILDEPTSGLDPLMQDSFGHLVREIASQGRTVFLSSHDLDEVQRVADRVAIIRDGRLVVTDTVEGLRRTAPRTIELTLAAPADVSRLASVPGVSQVATDGHVVTLQVSGSLAPLLRAAAELDPIDITARRADLEELFLRYYRPDTTTGPAVDTR